MFHSIIAFDNGTIERFPIIESDTRDLELELFIRNEVIMNSGVLDCLANSEDVVPNLTTSEEVAWHLHDLELFKDDLPRAAKAMLQDRIYEVQEVHDRLYDAEWQEEHVRGLIEHCWAAGLA